MSRIRPNTVRLFIVEEQEIYRELYRLIFPLRTPSGLSGSLICPIDLLGVSGNGDVDSMKRIVSSLEPDVLLFSTKKLDKELLGELEQIRMESPKIGLALFLGAYGREDIDSLRELALKGEGGMALFLKQSLDIAEQLHSIIMAVSQRQVILDPELTALIFADKPVYPFLKQLTSREAEILSLVSKGYTNGSIAGNLFIDIKPVEHHINSMYSKLKSTADFNEKHPRVSATRLYLEATGELVKIPVSERKLAFSGSC